MENTKFRIALLWAVIICGFALHTLADLLPLFWSVPIAVDASGEAPAGLLAFMMLLCYPIPIGGILCTLYGRRRRWAVANAVLAAFMLLFNLLHTGELFVGFNPAQLMLLPIILAVSALLLAESLRAAKKR